MALVGAGVAGMVGGATGLVDTAAVFTDKGTCAAVSDRSLDCDLGVLAPGETAIVKMVTTPTRAGVLLNQVGVVGDVPDPNNHNNTFVEQTLVIDPPPPVPVADLIITKSDMPDPVVVNLPMVYTMVVKNLGPDRADGVILTDILPLGVIGYRATPSQGFCIQEFETLNCELGSLPVGASAVVIVNAVPTVVGVMHNVAKVVSLAFDPVPATNVVEEPTIVRQLRADVSVFKIDSPDPVRAGHPLTYDVVVTNHGPDPTRIRLADLLQQSID